ncbi:MAG: T9SS type A sorting domain-containing protein [Paludibacteraceae bacterium]|nr:T9SS type A sorting domain-containing protein [Paludibacteraceae bacterium]
MKLASKLGLMVALLFSCWTMTNAQNSVSILDKNGAITTYQMAQSGKIFFENDYLMIKETSNSNTKTYLLSNIKKVFFGEFSDIDDVNGTQVSIFPNPTTDNVYIAYAKEGDKTEIFTWNGILLAEKSYSIGNGVSLSEFPIGLYIIRINGQSFKISKK